MKLIKTPTARLSEEQWQALRRRFVKAGMVGGSDAGTLLGLNPYSSPINLFYKAVSDEDIPNKMNHAMFVGKHLESFVANCWQYYDGSNQSIVDNEAAGKKVKKYRKVKAIIQNPKYPALFANIDGQMVSPRKGILEIKTISGYAADQYEKGIPESYIAQVQLYMLVTGLDYAEIFFMKDGREFGLVPVEANKDMQDLILETANDHYNRVREARAAVAGRSGEELYQYASQWEPPVDGTDAYSYFLSERHKAKQTEGKIHAPQMDAEIARFIGAKAMEEEWAEKKQYCSNFIKKFMQDNGASKLTTNLYTVSWRTQFRISLNKAHE